MCSGIAPALFAQNNVTTPPACSPISLSGAYNQNFDTLASSGTTNTALPAGWQFNEQGSGAAANGQYSASTGSDNGGNAYSYGASGSSERALGQLRSGSNAIIIGACFQNTSSNTITSLAINYRGELWRAGVGTRANPQDQMDFQYKIGATSVTDASGWADVNDLDFVSQPQPVGAVNGNAVFSTPTGVISGLNIPPGGTFFIRWTDQDPSGADDGMGIDDFNLTPGFSSGATMSINGPINVSEAAGTATFTVSISSPAGPGGVSFTVNTVNGTATGGQDFTAITNQVFTIPSGASSIPVNVTIINDSLSEGDETFSVVISNPTVGYTIVSSTGVATINDDDPLRISQIQGSGLRSPFENQNVFTRGIVTQVIGKGYFVQSLASDDDGDPSTSEGLFVFTGTAGAKPAVGDTVNINGRVTEYTDDNVGATLTQITNTGLVWTKTGTAALPAFTVVPDSDMSPNQPCSTGFRVDALEKYEGMRVTFNSLVVVQSTELSSNTDENGSFYATLSSLGRRFRESGIECNSTLRNGSTPITVPVNTPYYDSNPEVIAVDTDRGGFAKVEVAVGRTFPSLSGVLDWSLRTYTLIPSAAITGDTFPASTPVRAPRAGEFTLVSMNIERLVSGSGTVGKVGTAIRTKLNLPDIIAIQEATSEAILDQIANAAKASPGDPQIYESYLQTSPNDTIHVGFLIKITDARPGVPRVQFTSATQVGVPDTNPCNGTDLNDRPPYILRATVNSATASLPVTIVGVHQKSLLEVDDPTSGNCNRQKRQFQSQFLANLVQSLQTGGEKIFVLGDFNAFQFNDGLVDVVGDSRGVPAPPDQVLNPVADLVTSDLLVLEELLLPAAERWSYLFRGDAQVLDHILASQGYLPNLSGLTYLHNNAPYPGSLKADTSRTERFSDHDNPVAYILVDTPVDVTSGIGYAQGSFTYNRAQQTFSQFVTITNNTGAPITKPLQVVLTNLPANVTAVVPDSDYYQGNPFKTVAPSGLAAGQSVTVQLVFRNPSLTGITYTPKLYVGAF